MNTSASSSVQTCLAQWRNKLIDLTRRNPLIALRPTQNSYLLLSDPSPPIVFDRLVQDGKRWIFWMPPDEEGAAETDAAPEIPNLEPPALRPDELRCAGRSRRRLRGILTNLLRRAHTDYHQRGLRI